MRGPRGSKHRTRGSSEPATHPACLPLLRPTFLPFLHSLAGQVSPRQAGAPSGLTLRASKPTDVRDASPETEKPIFFIFSE